MCFWLNHYSHFAKYNNVVKQSVHILNIYTKKILILRSIGTPMLAMLLAGQRFPTHCQITYFHADFQTHCSQNLVFSPHTYSNLL